MLLAFSVMLGEFFDLPTMLLLFPALLGCYLYIFILRIKTFLIIDYNLQKDLFKRFFGLLLILEEIKFLNLSCKEG